MERTKMNENLHGSLSNRATPLAVVLVGKITAIGVARLVWYLVGKWWSSVISEYTAYMFRWCSLLCLEINECHSVVILLLLWYHCYLIVSRFSPVPVLGECVSSSCFSSIPPCIVSETISNLMIPFLIRRTIENFLHISLLSIVSPSTRDDSRN